MVSKKRPNARVSKTSEKSPVKAIFFYSRELRRRAHFFAAYNSKGSVSESRETTSIPLVVWIYLLPSNRIVVLWPLRFCSNEKKTWAGWSLKSSVRTKYRFVIEKKRVEKYSSKYPLKSNLVTCASGSHLKNLHVEHILSGNRTRRRLDYEFKRILWRTLQFLWFRAVFFCYRVH